MKTKLLLALILFQFAASAQTLRFLAYFSPTNEVVSPTNWVVHAASIRNFTNATQARFGGTVAPITSDGAALGSGTLMWSDLFLASGGIINLNNGDLLITHSANTVTITGGNLIAPIGSSTIDASGFNGNLATTDDTVQKVAQKLDDLTAAGGGDVTAASAFGTDDVLIKSDGTGKGVQATGISVDGSNNISGVGSITGSGSGVTVIANSAGINLTNNSVNANVNIGAPLTLLSNMFVPSGWVLDFNAGDLTLTHSANTLTLAGGNLVANGTVTIGGVLTQTGNVELNHASANTLSASGGDLSIEGVVLAKRTGGNTLGGRQLLSEGAFIEYDAVSSADGAASGTIRAGTAGATLAFGDLIYLDPTDSRWELADANSASGADGDARGSLGICVLAAASDGSATLILFEGIVRADAAFPALTINSPVYVSETAGDITHTSPTTEDNVVRQVGVALTGDEIHFRPPYIWTVYDAP